MSSLAPIKPGAFRDAVLPLLLAHIAVPPLSVVRSKGLKRLLGERIHSSFESFIDLLTRDGNAPWCSVTRLTSMFIHGNYNHLIDNLSALLMFGYHVSSNFGANVVLFLFLAGGYFASLPSFIQKDWVKEVARSRTSEYTHGIPCRSPLTCLVSLWDWIGAPLHGMEHAAQYTNGGVGSSGGGSALIGCSLVLQLRDVLKVVYRSVRARWVRDCEST